jgi:hypothetical protein
LIDNFCQFLQNQLSSSFVLSLTKQHRTKMQIASILILSITIIQLMCYSHPIVKPAHLTSSQMRSIRRLLNNPALPPMERATVQRVLFVSHEKWAAKKAREFKAFHRYKCRDISLDELVLAGKAGLFKSSQKYDGGAEFVRFSEIYVKSELLKTMTARLAATSCLSARERMSSKTPVRSIEYQRHSTSIIYRMDIFNNRLPSSEPQPTERFQISPLLVKHAHECEDAFTKRIMNLKLQRIIIKDARKPLSNSHIAKLMCCSEETVRLTIRKFMCEFYAKPRRFPSEFEEHSE